MSESGKTSLWNRNSIRQFISEPGSAGSEKGHLYLRIVHHDSFGPAHGWEIRDSSAYRSTREQDLIQFAERSQFRGIEEWMLHAWVAEGDAFDSAAKHRVEAASVELDKHMQRLLQIRIPLLVAFVPMAVADGCTFFVSIFGGIQAGSHFVWREGHPPKGWEPLQLFVDEFIDCFPTVSR